jgi:pyridinium-3,5-bisthiocarboxylic acid mononucleotide nickel chelatase
MKIAYLDTVSGIAGDMTIAAFLGAGVPLDALTDGLRGLGVGGFDLTATRVRRNSIDAVHVDVVLTEHQHAHRHLHHILDIIAKSSLPKSVRQRSEAVFTVLAEAEARVHGTTAQKVHFHEVGAVDAIVDIVGTSLCMELAGIDRLYTSPVKLGSGGTIRGDHGVMPNPAPATVEILRDYPTVTVPVPHELTTPTGAAIVKALSSGVLGPDPLVIRSVGYGAGTREFAELPNVLRLVIGETAAAPADDDVMVLEANIDDMNPQVFPYVIERILNAGALDAFLTPIVMKKGRPAYILTALSEPSRVDVILSVMTSETTTIGVRMSPVHRHKLVRESVEVQTSFGPVRAKRVVRNGAAAVTAEYDEAARIARSTGLPLLDVMKQLQNEIEAS